MHITYTSEQIEIQPKLVGANINPETFLATDYLNHFNEIVMLLEMIPDMPELIEDASEWAPKTYNQHFLDSGFQAKDLAVRAFNLAPDGIRNAFNQVCESMNTTILTTLAGLVHLNVAERGFSPAARELVRQRVQIIHELLMKLNQVIHGQIGDDFSIGENQVEEPAEPEDVQSQEDIDKLFD
ncbi:MAG: hypothetical protein COB37_03015 [Kordiimonadales bacterium]|nr:MAG: hypothetical protein COB37_03015 [Kordiimonadales bacterium]